MSDGAMNLVGAFRDAVIACDPTRRVAAVAPSVTEEVRARGGAIIGVAIGKAALAMARGVPVDRGIVVSPVDGEVESPVDGAVESPVDGGVDGAVDGGVDGAVDGAVEPTAESGWRVRVSSHPHPDARSVAAARDVRALIASATPNDLVLALISGGSSALIEDPILALDDFVATIRALMHAGAPIDELNTVRSALSNVKAGKLVAGCRARVVTLVASDVIGDRVDVIGSGPTVAPAEDDEMRRRNAIAILGRRGVDVPLVLQEPISGRREPRADDEVRVILPMRAFADALADTLELRVIDAPYLAIDAGALLANGPCVAWGEPTLRVPADHGVGGRAQQLALEVARRIRGTDWHVLVAGTDGIDGPPPPGRPAPAGALVDGTTWDAIDAAGIDPERALARCDAGTALAAVGALVVTGATGVNHADVAIVVRKPA